MYGHIKVPLGIAFQRVDFPFSDGAKLIAEYGRRRILQPGWLSVFEPERVKEQVKAIVTGTQPSAPYVEGKRPGIRACRGFTASTTLTLMFPQIPSR